MSVWLLIAISSTNHFLTTTNIDVETGVFESAESCVRNIPLVEEQLKKNLIKLEFFALRSMFIQRIGGGAVLLNSMVSRLSNAFWFMGYLYS